MQVSKLVFEMNRSILFQIYGSIIRDKKTTNTVSVQSSMVFILQTILSL